MPSSNASQQFNGKFVGLVYFKDSCCYLPLALPRFFFTVIEFLKLEKVEIGGLRGRQLSTRITDVYVEFNQYFTAFASKSYDVLDPDDHEFDEDFKGFQTRILELDMKLAAILCQAFDDCHNLESIFKVSRGVP